MSHEPRLNLDELLQQGADLEAPDGLAERIGSAVDHAAAVRRRRVVAGVGLAAVVLVTGVVLIRGGGLAAGPGVSGQAPLVAQEGGTEELMVEEPARLGVEPARVAIHDAENMLIEHVESSNPNVTIILMYETVRTGRVDDALPQDEGGNDAF